jgi:hypothetical protein
MNKPTVTVELLTSPDLWRRAASLTVSGKSVNMPVSKLYMCEHSPIRTVIFWIELRGIPSFVSVHLVRHKIGVEHYVQSLRDDRGGTGKENRLTPTDHGMILNAETLITMSRKRLCLKSHQKTVATWTRVKHRIAKVDSDLAPFMVPDCVYRNGKCYQLSECKPGLEKVMRAYGRIK